MPELKECRGCGTVQPVENFKEFRRTKDQKIVRRSRCQQCLNAERAEHDRRQRQKNRPPAKIQLRHEPLPPERTCRLCGVTKPIDQFHKTGRLRLDGGPNRRRVCGTCTNRRKYEWEKRRDAADPEAARIRNNKLQRQYCNRHRMRYREYQKTYHREWAARNPERVQEYRERTEERRRLKKLHQVPPNPPAE